MDPNGCAFRVDPSFEWPSTKVGEMACSTWTTVRRSTNGSLATTFGSNGTFGTEETNSRFRPRPRCCFTTQALAGFDGPEVQCLQAALTKARHAARGIPLKEQLSQTKAFIARSRKRLAALDQERAEEQESLEKALQRQERLKEDIAAEPRAPLVSSHNQFPPPAWAAEMEALRAKLANSRGRVECPEFGPRREVEEVDVHRGPSEPSFAGGFCPHVQSSHERRGERCQSLFAAR